MLVPRPPHLLRLAAAAGLVAGFAVAAPAGATEGPAAAPPPPWNLTAPSFVAGAQAPFGAAPSKPGAHRRPSIKGARVVPHRIRKGKRASLRLSLRQAGTVQYTVTRTSAPHRGRVTTKRISVAAGKVSIRLPRALASGRYTVSATVADASGSRSRAVSRSLVVRSAHR